MARIALTIDPSYKRSWGLAEGVRELLQNAKDADEHEALSMTIKHLPQSSRLVISNAGATPSAPLLLLLGSTTKEDGKQRGRFGEGFVLGLLALTRAGHPVTVYTADETWRPELAEPDPGHPFEGNKMLVIATRKLQKPREDFTVEVENVSKGVWDVLKKRFLFLTPPKAEEVVKIEGSFYGGRILLNEEYKGCVFARGIYVCTVEDLKCGYDLNDIKLNSDRSAIDDDFSFRYRLCELWKDAVAQDPDRFSRPLYEMVKEERPETKNLVYNADERILKKIREEFEAENGAGAIGVSDMGEARELEQLGAKTAIVNKSLKELLEKGGPGVATTKARLRSAVKRTFNWSELTSEEGAACSDSVERVTKDYVVVEFNDATVLCRILEDQGKIGVSRELLARSPREVVSQLAACEAIRRGTNVADVLLDVLFAPPPSKLVAGVDFTYCDEGSPI